MARGETASASCFEALHDVIQFFQVARSPHSFLRTVQLQALMGAQQKRMVLYDTCSFADLPF
jgi:hypothetical protein